MKLNSTKIKISKAMTDYEMELRKKTYEPSSIPRFFVDIRSGCAAIRDRGNKRYNEKYRELHHDTPDVILYVHGYIEENRWCIDPEDIATLRLVCGKLNDAAILNFNEIMAMFEMQEIFAYQLSERLIREIFNIKTLSDDENGNNLTYFKNMITDELNKIQNKVL